MVVGRSSFSAAGWVFRRLLGVVYLFAYWSLGRQVTGLIGEHGILPARVFMESARTWAAAQHIGIDRFRMLPTLCWISTSDAFLTGLCAAGAMLAILLIIGIAPLLTLPLLWLGYVSLSIVSDEFLGYQWDTLLLETGFLAIFIAPARWRDSFRHADDVPRLGRWLVLWLLFRLMFGSGAMKLATGDPTWRNLTAMSVHFETQPIPTPVAWFAHRLPLAFDRITTAATLGIELIAPLFIVGPRRARLVACGLLIGLQVAIALTGNYAFFNLLSAALCLFLIDDGSARGAISRCGVRLPAYARGVFSRAPARHAEAPEARRRQADLFRLKPEPTYVRRATLIAVAVVWVPATIVAFGGALRMRLPGWQVTEPVASLLAPLRIANTYGLFSVMTTTRPEIVVEGSEDGVEWHEYAFKYKPGDPRRRPPWVAPHQPRLDWQMWFAALGSYESEPWFRRFCERLLEGSPEVLKLMEHDPFAGRPPRFVRGVLYQYRFSDATTRRTTGAWWTRQRLGDYSPILTSQF